jgi:UPF0755 protein
MTSKYRQAKVLGSLVLASLTVFGLAAIWHFNDWRNTPLELSAQTIYQIPKGATAYQVIRDLNDLKIVTQSNYLRFLIEWTTSTNRLKAGEYLIRSGVSPDQLLSMLVNGDVLQHQVTIVDGTTVHALLQQLNADDRLQSLPTEIDVANLANYLGLSLTFVEGYFLPNTYQVERGDSVAGVLERAHKAMQKALANAWAMQTNVRLESPEALLTLASIIEKESGQPQDRHQISQVFHRRLSLNMRLQTDPTVIYALGREFDGNLRRRDLAIDSPFNTYRVKGLPPTPIALPSMAALTAAAHPAKGDFLYFVARGDGSSEFSKTLAEHNAAVRKFQLSTK